MKMNLRPIFEYRLRKFGDLGHAGTTIAKVPRDIAADVSPKIVPWRPPKQPSHFVDFENVFWQTFSPGRLIDRVLRKDSQRLWESGVKIEGLPAIICQN